MQSSAPASLTRTQTSMPANNTTEAEQTIPSSFELINYNFDQFSEYLVGQEMTGKFFNEEFPDKLFIKIMNDDDNHRGYQYQTGANTTDGDFYPYGRCQAGGLYFFDVANFAEQLYDWGKYYRVVTIPDDARVYIEDRKAKTDKI